MDRHLSGAAVERLLTRPQGGASEGEPAAISHVIRCRRCFRLVGATVAGLRRSGTICVSERGSFLVGLMAEEQKHGRRVLEAQARWFEMREQSPEQQIRRIKDTPSLRTVELFETVLESARSTGAADPQGGGATADVARELAELLRVPQAARNEMSGEALTVLANCRRLAADWRGAHQAITQAGRLIKEPAGQARLLSIHGSVACDTGNLDLALDLLQRAAALYRAEADPDGTQRTAVKLAGTLLAAGRPREAVELAESLGETGDVRLDVLARGIVIEGLVLLDRAEEALLHYLDGEHLWEQAPELRLRVGYLGALLLNGLGSQRDAERLLRGVGQAYAEAEQYKESFLTFLTLFEMQLKHEAFAKAAEVCTSVLEIIKFAGNACHDQMKAAWVELRTAARAGTVTSQQIMALRVYLARHWKLPATCGPFQLEISPACLPDLSPELEQETEADAVPAAIEPAADYKTTLELVDARLLRDALDRNAWSIRSTARKLGISKTTLKARMARYSIVR